MIDAQNDKFLKAASSGAALPKYKWPVDGAPNCPPLEDPAAIHQAELEREIAHQAHLIEQGVVVDDNRDELRAQLETAARFHNDITRLPAFARYAALCKFSQGDYTE